MNNVEDKKIIIFLALYNGEEFLSQQLDSIEKQTHKNWVVIVSDDGSVDNSKEIILSYQKKWGESSLIYQDGPRKGFCLNFLTLAHDLRYVGDYYLFCDQDDVWLPTKLISALESAFKNEKVDLPFLYGGRTTYVTKNLKIIKKSPLYIFPCSFRNALVQNIFGGNTIFFNHSTKELLQKIEPVNSMSHDWWLYLIVSGVGGIVVYDQNSYVLYRQHNNSQIGGGFRNYDRLKRLFSLLYGRFKGWTDLHIQLLEKNQHFLTFESLQILSNFKILRESKLTRRFRMLEICGLYRQTMKATISLYLAILIKKI